MAHEGKSKLTIENVDAEFRLAYQDKQKLIKRELEDHLFALGEQWTSEEKAKLEKAGIEPTTDNRIAPNLYLLTGLERQNRSEFRAFPEGEEDSLKAEIASVLLKHIVKKSGYNFEASDQFKDGITSGESHLEFYLDYSENLINGSVKWVKCDGDSLFPDPHARKYDLDDAQYVYKVRYGISVGDLINLFPDKKAKIKAAGSGRINREELRLERGKFDIHRQRRDYPGPKEASSSEAGETERDGFDLIERYYKKWVTQFFVGDRKTGRIANAPDKEAAESFVEEYRRGIEQDAQAGADAGITPPAQDPDRYQVMERQVPEIWVFSYAPGINEPLADERAWFYPKWKKYPFVTFYARFSTAPIEGNDKHLLVQGLVHGVKGSQKKHNRSETLMLRHLNTATNSGWLTEEDTWVDKNKVEQFGTSPGVNLEYKRSRRPPERIIPMPLSQAHAVISSESAESIKAQLGINSDLLAIQDSGRASGRAIALRQRQGLLMVQELFDNHARSRQYAGRMLLSQLGEVFDTETALRVLGEAFLTKNFPPPTELDEQTGEPVPVVGEDGQPMKSDIEAARIVLEEVLSGDLEKYDVAVGEGASHESQRMANAAEVREIAAEMPGLVPPEIIVKHSQLPEAVKTEIISAIAAAKQAAAQEGKQLPTPVAKKPTSTKKETL